MIYSFCNKVDLRNKNVLTNITLLFRGNFQQRKMQFAYFQTTTKKKEFENCSIRITLHELWLGTPLVHQQNTTCSSQLMA
jgi:hypothetical protein